MRFLLHSIAVAICLGLQPTAAFAQQENSPWVARTIAPSVHMLEVPEDYYAAAIGNVGVIEQADGFVVIDSGMTAGHGRAIIDYVRSLSPEKAIKAVVITHWHNDHPQGVSAIRDAFPKVRIIATEATRAGMLGPEVGTLAGLAPSPQVDEAARSEGARAIERIDALIADATMPEDRRARLRKARGQWEKLVASWPGTYIVPPNETFGRKLDIPDPAVPVSIRFLGRANTAGDAVIWLPRQRVVFTGDVVVAPVPYGFFSYPADWVRVLGRIKSLGFSTLVPGHGASQGNSKYINIVTGSIEDIRNQVGPLAKGGMPLAEIRTKVDFKRFEAIFVPNPRFKPLFDQNWIAPMIENAFKEAKGVPIVQGEGEVQADPREKERRTKQ